MKKRVPLIASLFVLAFLAASQAANAQQAMIVNIPFEFMAHNATLPPGEYRVESLTGQSVLLLRHQEDADATAIVPTIATRAVDPSSQSKLLFNRYGDRYFLSQFWIAGNSGGRQLLPSPREKEVAKVARVETKGQVVLIARLAPPKP